MSYKNPPILAILNPTGFAEVMEYYRTAFATLPWLEKSLGRAYEQPEQDNTRRVPKVPIGGGEYYNCLPNDNLKSQSFLMSRSAERYTAGQEAGRERDVSTVFWLNQKQVPFTTEDLIGDVTKIIEAAPWTTPAGIGQVFDERVEDIFFGYLDADLLEKNYQFLKFPYVGFRIDFVAGWPVPC